MSKRLTLLLPFLLVISNGIAQFNRTYQEIGVMAGPVLFQSDYGERGDLDNLIKNNGVTVGLFYYLSFIENYPNIRENLKLRLEASYMKSELQHYGKYVDPNKTSLFAQQLRAMRGSTQTASLGFQIEYYPFKTDDYTRADFSPYISLGSQYNNFTSKAWSTLGPLGTPLTTPEKYIDGFRNDTGSVVSFSASMGARYKLSDYHAIIAETRWQYYMSDWVDGLNPDKSKYKENKANDYSFALTFGYVYYFN
ncbi:THC0290_0291 family protein [Flavobacterium sp. UBA6135]|uniref:THC0290_0291 family protein n=1 Tax=Flavobacterium sp. UBA6135 TaxID=1946553 RepID=UPI0025B97F26|nr:glutamate dehydrogenase [Flavobacterium sp. UBA6135]